MRVHAVLPYQDGAALAALDSERRTKILAETGEHAVVRVPVAPSAPAEASTATRVAANSAMNSTIASGQTKDHHDAATQTATTDKASKSSAGGTYTVAKGDTLSSIAKTHSVEVSQLREWNNLKSDNIKLGQTLRLSSN